MKPPFWLEPTPVIFPPTELAMTDPNGLLAVGGALTPEWLLSAYSKGIFPWYNEDEPILWWSPSPRCVLATQQVKIRRSLKKVIRQNQFQVTLDTAFQQVMTACAQQPRKGQDGTWINANMIAAYTQLHQKGHAHSVEVWHQNKLVGGLYGMAIGKMFYGESMFSQMTDSSKIALVALCMQLNSWGFKLIDSQVETDHLVSMGAQNISRTEFEAHLKTATRQAFVKPVWTFDLDWQAAALAHSIIG